MRPLNEYVLVERLEEQKKNGIIIIDTDPMTEYHTGIVKALSVSPRPGAEQLKVGATIIYKHFRNMKIDGMECIKFEDIICIDDGHEEPGTKGATGKKPARKR